MNEKIPVRCQIAEYKLSAHADRDSLLELVEILRPKATVLVHGNASAIRRFGKPERDLTFPTIIMAPQKGEIISPLKVKKE